MKWLLLIGISCCSLCSIAQSIPARIYDPSSNSQQLPSYYAQEVGVVQVEIYNQKLTSNGKLKKDSMLSLHINYLPDSNILTGFYLKNDASKLTFFRNYYNDDSNLQLRLTWKSDGSQSFDTLYPTLPDVFNVEVYQYNTELGELTKKMFYFGMSDFNYESMLEPGIVNATDSLGFEYKLDEFGRPVQQTDIDKNSRDITKKIRYEGNTVIEEAFYKGKLNETTVTTSTEHGIYKIETKTGMYANDPKSIHFSSTVYDYTNDPVIAMTTKDSVLDLESHYKTNGKLLKTVDHQVNPPKILKYNYQNNHLSEIIDVTNEGKPKTVWKEELNDKGLIKNSASFENDKLKSYKTYHYKIN